MEKIKLHGAAHVSDIGWLGFKEAALFIEQPEILQLDELRIQYREFNRRLAKIVEERTEAEKKKKVNKKKNHIEILDMFLNPKMNLYKYVNIINWVQFFINFLLF